jgi:hypothetical protein
MLSSMNDALIVNFKSPFKGLSPTRQAFYIIRMPGTRDRSVPLLA